MASSNELYEQIENGKIKQPFPIFAVFVIIAVG